MQKIKNSAFWQDIHIRETIRGSGIFMSVRILGTLGAYLFAWFISKEYGPEGNGIMAFTLTFAVLLAALFNLGLNTYAVKVISGFRAEKNEAAIERFTARGFGLVGATTLTGSSLLIILSFLIHSPTWSRDILLVGCMTIPVSFLLYISHLFKARKKILGFSLLQNNIVQFVALAILVLPLWTRISVAEPVWAFIIAAMGLVVMGYIKSSRRITPPIPSESSTISDHLKLSLPMLAGGLAFMILSMTDRLMLRFLDTTAALGVYDIGLRLSNITLLGILSINAIAEPKFAEFWAQNDRVNLRKFVNRMTWAGFLISVPVIGILGLFPKFWLGMFGDGREFLVGMDSLYILLIGQLISVLCGSVLVLLNMTGNQWTVQTILVTAAILNIMLNAILIPNLGIEGAAWATTISTIFWNVWGIRAVRKKLGFWVWK